MAQEKKEEREIKKVQPRINLAVDKPVFTWESPEFVRYKKDNKWMAYLIIIAIVLCVVLGFMQQWSGIALVVVAAIVFITLSGAHPKSITSAVYAEGLVIDGKVYNYEQIKSFWISYGDLPKIRCQLTGRFGGIVTMPLGEEDPEQIRLFLAKHLPEEEDKGEDLSDMINRIIRF
jgi:hypothetical protein